MSMKMTPEACQASMKRLLLQATRLTSELSTLLDREFAAITDRDFTAFETIIQDKTMTVEQLDLLERERMALLESAGYKSGPDGMLYFLEWCDPGGAITPCWQELLTLAAACRDSNRRNHRLVELCGHHTREALRLLRGEDGQADVYQADGERSSGHGNRPLARA